MERAYISLMKVTVLTWFNPIRARWYLITLDAIEMIRSLGARLLESKVRQEQQIYPASVCSFLNKETSDLHPISRTRLSLLQHGEAA